MTREDAIYWLGVLKMHSEKRDAQTITEALDMAIEALEQTEPQKEVIACPIIDDDAWIYEEYRKGIDYAWSIAQKVFDSTVTFYEAEDVAKQIDKDINVRNKDCETCNHYRLTCDLFSEICKYEPKDEPQTEDEILREQCRAFMGIVEHTERSE